MSARIAPITSGLLLVLVGSVLTAPAAAQEAGQVTRVDLHGRLIAVEVNGIELAGLEHDVALIGLDDELVQLEAFRAGDRVEVIARGEALVRVQKVPPARVVLGTVVWVDLVHREIMVAIEGVGRIYPASRLVLLDPTGSIAELEDFSPGHDIAVSRDRGISTIQKLDAPRPGGSSEVGSERIPCAGARESVVLTGVTPTAV